MVIAHTNQDIFLNKMLCLKLFFWCIYLQLFWNQMWVKYEALSYEVKFKPKCQPKFQRIAILVRYCNVLFQIE